MWSCAMSMRRTPAALGNSSGCRMRYSRGRPDLPAPRHRARHPRLARTRCPACLLRLDMFEIEIKQRVFLLFGLPPVEADEFYLLKFWLHLRCGDAFVGRP